MAALLRRAANAPAADYLPTDDRASIVAHVERRIELLAGGPAALGDVEARRLSAELNGLLLIEQCYGSFEPGTTHLLVHSDTLFGRNVYSALAAWIHARWQGQIVEAVTANGLRTDSLDEFWNAAAEVARDLVLALDRPGVDSTFNLVGGFKAIVVLMQTVGAAVAERVVTVFEASAELFEIPRLPARADVPPNVQSQLRRIAVLGSVPQVDAEGISDFLLRPLVDGRVALSAFGELTWASLRSEAYRSVMPVVDERVVIDADLARRAAKALGLPEVVKEFNHQIDRLCALVAQVGIVPEALVLNSPPTLAVHSPVSAPRGVLRFDVNTMRGGYRAWMTVSGGRLVVWDVTQVPDPNSPSGALDESGASRGAE